MRNVIICIVLAIIVTFLLPLASLESAASGLLAFSGLLIAMLIPTMALNVTALRPFNGRHKQASKLGEALIEQFDYWAQMLWLTLILAGLLIVGNILSWSDYRLVLPIRGYVIDFQPIYILNAFVWFSIVMLVMKLGGFVSGFRSLLKLHVDQIVEDKQIDDQAKHTERDDIIEARAPNANFGKLVDD